MDTNDIAIISVLLYKIAALLLGGFSIYLGYKLFAKGIWGNSGDLEAKFSSSKLVLKSAAPGTFFAVLGSVIIVAVIFVKFRVTNSEGGVGGEFTTEQRFSVGEEGDDPEKPELEDIIDVQGH